MYLVFHPLGLGLDKVLFDWNSVNRGANGGLAGSDMCVIHKPHRKINIQGIDNHEVTGLDVVTAATLLNTSQGKVIGIFN